MTKRTLSNKTRSSVLKSQVFVLVWQQLKDEK